MFVGDINTGRLYHFELNQNRTELLLNNLLADKIADTDEELIDLTFGEGFQGITDLEVGPYDGNLYMVSFGQGAIFSIIPKNQ
jgi:hypothetical protein